MGNVVFAQRVGRTKPAAGAAAVMSASSFDHVLSVAQHDAAQKNFKPAAAHSKEIAELYNAAVKDGRYIGDLGSDPSAVATKLGKNLSAAAAAEIKTAAGLRGIHTGGGGTVSSVTVVCIAVVVVLCADVGPNQEVIVDRSGMLKF